MIKIQVNAITAESKVKLVTAFREYVNLKIYFPDSCLCSNKFNWLQFNIPNLSSDTHMRMDVTHYQTEYLPDEYKIVSLEDVLYIIRNKAFPTYKQNYQVKCTSPAQIAALFNYYKNHGYTICLNQENWTLDQLAEYYFENFPVIIIYPETKYISSNKNIKNDYYTLPFADAFELGVKNLPVKLKLNENRTAIIKNNGDIDINGETFSGAIILELAELVKNKLANRQ